MKHLFLRPLASTFLIGRRGGVEHNITFEADLLDQIELALEEIDMILLVVQDLQGFWKAARKTPDESLRAAREADVDVDGQY